MRPMVIQEFGSLPNGRNVHVFTLTSRSGIEVRVIDYGGIVMSNHGARP